MRALRWTLMLITVLIAVKQSRDGIDRARQEPSSALGTYDRAPDAEKAALAELSSLLHTRPKARRYTITYSYQGHTFGGEADKSLTFNPDRHTLFDLYRSSGETRLLLSGVTVEQIHAAARRGATLDNFRVRVNPVRIAPRPGAT